MKLNDPLKDHVKLVAQNPAYKPIEIDQAYVVGAVKAIRIIR